MRRFSPWLPVLLLLALAAYLIPQQRLTIGTTRPPGTNQALPGDLPQDTRALFEQARPATVRVESLNPVTRDAGIGTGFFISAEGQVLTAYHVVSGGTVYQVNTLSGQAFPARVSAFDAEADVALLQVEARNPHFPFLTVASRAPRIGQEVLAIGNSGGDYLQPRRGRLLALDVAAGRADFPQGTLEMNAPLAPGDSGGPIINGDGQAIGVISYIRVNENGQTRRSYAVPVVEGEQLLQSLRAGEKRDVPVAGLILDIVHSGQTDTPGGVIQGVARSGPAEKAGLQGSQFDDQGQLTQLGDVITSVNGQRTRDANEVITAIRKYQIGQIVTLEYQRNGQTHQTQLQLVPKATLPDLRE